MLAQLSENRFADYLCSYFPQFPICADSKSEFKYQKTQPRKTALELNRWITYNQSFLNVLLFDLDDMTFHHTSQVRQLCIDNVGLVPTWVCLTEGGAHVAYVLENMIDYDWKTIELAQRIKIAVSDALSADTKGSHRLKGFWRNPLLHIHDVSYLEYSLVDFYPVLNNFESQNFGFVAHEKDYLKHRHRAGELDLDWRVGNRNSSLWYRSMMLTNSKMGDEEIKKIVFDLHHSSCSDAPLGFNEIMRTYKSVLKYNRENRNYVVMSALKREHHVNSGAMRLPPIRTLDRDEYLDEVERRQSLSALRTANMKAKETLNRLKDAVLRLNFLGLALTQANIALYAERSKGTVNRYLKEGLLDVDRLLERVCSISSYFVIEPRGVSLVTLFDLSLFDLSLFDLSLFDFNLLKFVSFRWRCFDPPPD